MVKKKTVHKKSADKKKTVHKKSTAKKTVRKKVTTKKPLLSEALKDINTEIRNLSGNKTFLKKDLRGVLGSIGGDRKKEKELQQRIARLIEKEAKLNQRKKILQTKIDRVADKMNKISKIKSEMSDI
ncbi:TPA: hypothetical protein EYQ19_01665 [Candidatus Pacearchaeota archaeon]|jgi:chromosome segregation ATPase|nr:hypothetical protein [Candidatus Pacearchaeota archaeon]